MNTNDDIELHDLQTIEARLRTELSSDPTTPEVDAADSSRALVGAASGFLVT